MVHHICCIVVKRLHSVQFAADGDQAFVVQTALKGIRCDFSGICTYDRASNQRKGDLRAERPSPGAGTRIKGQNRPKAIRVLNENNHEKRNQNQERSKRDESTAIPNCFVIPNFW
jgi:hypothetical protein